MKQVKFLTKDGVEIHGLYTEAENKNATAVLLLHMMPAVKESWREFQEKLATVGFQSLAIDLRGHGESVFKNGKAIDYKNFTDAEQQEKIYDVEAAISFFKEQGIDMKNITLAGASIGANLALQYQVEHREIKASVLLSPGLDYRGLKTESLAENISEDQSVYLAGATQDSRSSGQSCADMAETLFSLLKSKNKKLKIIEGKEHGTDLLVAYPKLIAEIIIWLEDIYFEKDLRFKI